MATKKAKTETDDQKPEANADGKAPFIFWGEQKKVGSRAIGASVHSEISMKSLVTENEFDAALESYLNSPT